MFVVHEFCVGFCELEVGSILKNLLQVLVHHLLAMTVHSLHFTYLA